jgi:hypothetical protein
VFGLAAVGIAGWAWRRKPQSIAQTTPDRHENI